MTGVQIPAGTEIFLLHHYVQNGFGAHLASCPMDTMNSFLRGKYAIA
jgi:hypothetical protein